MIYFQGKRIFSAIFDMDGTMFDTERLRFKTLKQAAEEIYGTPLSEATLIGSLGLSAKKAEALARANHGEDFPYAQVRQRADEQRPHQIIAGLPAFATPAERRVASHRCTSYEIHHMCATRR